MKTGTGPSSSLSLFFSPLPYWKLSTFPSLAAIHFDNGGLSLSALSVGGQVEVQVPRLILRVLLHQLAADGEVEYEFAQAFDGVGGFGDAVVEFEEAGFGGGVHGVFVAPTPALPRKQGREMKRLPRRRGKGCSPASRLLREKALCRVREDAPALLTERCGFTFD